jgi:hypothetical protein
VDDGSARIELRRRTGPSMWAVVDLADLERVQRHRWHVLILPHTSYAQGRVTPGSQKMISLHRFIMNPGPGLDVDHINHDGLDNRRSNLRVATRPLNLGNSRPRAGSSVFKGVSWRKQERTWRAGIGVNGRNIHLGFFSTEEAAARAYDAAAREVFGEFAYLNFPEVGAA